MLLVTGATGFVGSHVVRRAVAEGRPVRGLVRRELGGAKFKVAAGNLLDPDSLARATAGVEVVVHAAAVTANLKPAEGASYDSVNRVGTENLLTAARAAGVRRIVLVSGLGTQPAPAGTYMATRWAMEEAVRTSGLEHVILQPSVLFGDGAAFVGALADLVRRSPIVPIPGRPGLQFQPLWIEDLVTCVLQSTTGAVASGARLPLGGAEILTLREIVEAIAAALQRRRVLVPLPLWSARLPAEVMSRVLRHPPITPASLELFAFDNSTEPDAVQRAFHFRPRAFREHVAAHGVDG